MQERVFLFLQGPHGPFYGELGRALRVAGCKVYRVGFNRGDQYYWPLMDCYLKFNEPQDKWRQWLGRLIDRKQVTDLVMYGDTRSIHQVAREEANLRGLAIHCFEEGYLRPYWITYERGGVIGRDPGHREDSTWPGRSGDEAGWRST